MRRIRDATGRIVAALRPAGSAPPVGERLAAREVAVLIASGLLALVSASQHFIEHVAIGDPTWPGASPLVLYIIAAGRALGGG